MSPSLHVLVLYWTDNIFEDLMYHLLRLVSYLARASLTQNLDDKLPMPFPYLESRLFSASTHPDALTALFSRTKGLPSRF